ncbi:hypothetical protein [Paenibacillus protaetiae]|uniref:Uncharacterized protein n=1 Tax=Paenibacillus protaetiae TaxID=2509456 RepID=A0A4V0YF63_9BACL|nr:hypothetical protein [Paenibacillus protaetiae]QAY66611.1 hypothetical protein ET464_09530 [Paenibacillus protaetiae]
MITLVTAIVLAAGSGAMVMWWLRDARAKEWCDYAAAAALFLFIMSVSGSVARTLLHGTVFLTEVHIVLLNPLFMASGAYLALYSIAAAFIYAAGSRSRTGVS